MVSERRERRKGTKEDESETGRGGASARARRRKPIVNKQEICGRRQRQAERKATKLGLDRSWQQRKKEGRKRLTSANLKFSKPSSLIRDQRKEMVVHIRPRGPCIS